MIKVKDLTVMIRNKPILNSIGFNVEKGDFCLIIGLNGSGKTTLLKTLAGQIKEYSGTIFFDEKKISSFSQRQIAKSLAFLPQEENFNLPFRVMDILMFGRYPYHSLFSNYSKEEKQHAKSVTDFFGLNELIERDIQTLSSGEKKKVFIASAFLQDVPLFLFDEPLNFLDPPSINYLLRLLAGFHNQGKTLIVSSHFIEYFFPFITKMVALKNGSIKYFGKKTLDRDILKQVYGDSFERFTSTFENI